MRWRVSDSVTAAQKETVKDSPPQVSPVHFRERTLTEADGYRPGTWRSDYQLNPEMSRPDGPDAWRPSGSYSTSVHNEGRSSWTRRMVMDDESEYGHYERTQTGDNSLYYRSGRPKLGVAMTPAEFRAAAEEQCGH
ncbi:hypothetical protein [Streptomyces subrutilus]|uniref:Uncharacterized protein n=1 Tax=Streptomyces subrutilus TaxID=36818 RepID=A0A1E5PXG3_9ACTN|nr:hypothetical protein [Streptomyces subrutilus]OEJ34181.1 hypothetical protein BGK67_25130 [Streptomyces subrutilus]